MFLKTIKDGYTKLHPEIFEFNENLICDKTREWLRTGELDEDGIPTCVQQVSDGIYSFWFLKPEYNQHWMEEIENYK